MVFPLFFWLMLAVCLLVSSIGFKNYVWFISLGYGFSIAAEGLAMLLLYGSSLTAGTLICCLLLLAYGLRLGGYLLIRERKSASYNKKMQGEIKEGKDIPLGVKIAIWITCGALYVTQVIPVFYRLHNGTGSDLWTYAGVFVAAFGLIFESVSDWQKNAAKKVNPHRFVDTGLYRIVRCPNYLGEMIFWTGILVSGIGSVCGIGQWAVALIGYAGIIYVMFSGARRLEIRQNKNYGNDPEYRQYVKTVPILLPFTRMYSVEKHKWLVA